MYIFLLLQNKDVNVPAYCPILQIGSDIALLNSNRQLLCKWNCCNCVHKGDTRFENLKLKPFLVPTPQF